MQPRWGWRGFFDATWGGSCQRPAALTFGRLVPATSLRSILRRANPGLMDGKPLALGRAAPRPAKASFAPKRAAESLAFDFPVNRHVVSGTSLGARRNVEHVGKALHKLLRLLPKTKVDPAGLEKKGCMTRFVPCCNLVRIFSDTDIARDDYPFLLRGDRSRPSLVRCIRSEALFEMHNLVLWFDQSIQTAGESRREIVVEEKSHALHRHAASDSSKANAS